MEALPSAQDWVAVAVVTGWAPHKSSTPNRPHRSLAFQPLSFLTRIAASGSIVSCCLPINVIVVQVVRVPFGRVFTSLYRF